MPNAIIINEIVKAKGVSIGWLEKQLGYSTSGLRKAIERKNDLKMDKVERLMSLFPDLNQEWIMTGKGEMFNKYDPPASITQESGIVASIEHIDYRHKYIESLEARLNEQSKALAEKEKAFEILAEQSKAVIKMLEIKIDTIQANLDSAVAERIGIVLKVDRNFEYAEKGLELMLSKFDALTEALNKKTLDVQKK